MANKLREKARLARLAAFLTANPQRAAQIEEELVANGELDRIGTGSVAAAQPTTPAEPFPLKDVDADENDAAAAASALVQVSHQGGKGVQLCTSLRSQTRFLTET